MASASVRLLTQGWSGLQRRALVTSLDQRQRLMVRDRIELERRAGKFEADEAADAHQFLATDGADGYSCGIVEWAAAVLFGADPAFREVWQAVRRGDGSGDGLPGEVDAGPATTIAPATDARGRAARAPGEAP